MNDDEIKACNKSISGDKQWCENKEERLKEQNAILLGIIHASVVNPALWP